MSSECFYEGCIFEGDLSIPEDEKFELNAHLFIEELKSLDDFCIFHNLSWSETARRYYAHS